MKYNLEGEQLVLFLEGELNSYNSEEVEKEIESILKANSPKAIVVDLENLTYISSAGLRAILFAQKTMDAQKGKMCVSHVCEEVMGTFELTCFTDILTII